MTDGVKRRQHYLPQFYLRRFSNEERSKAVALFNVSRERYVPSASIRDQAYRPFLYGEDQVVEDSLSRMEGEVSAILSRIEDNQHVPTSYSPGHLALVSYMLIQRRRTPRAGRDLIDMANLPLAIAYRDDPQWQGLGSEWFLMPENPVLFALASSFLWPCLLDLKSKLLMTDISPGFITSDNPVVYYNQLLEERRPHLSNVGLLTKGLQIFFPISPEALVLLYDGTIYKVGDRHSQAVHVSREEDLTAINSLQAAVVDENLYVAPVQDPAPMRRMVRRMSGVRKQYRTGADEYALASNPNSGIIHIRAPEVRCRLDISFMKEKRKIRHFSSAGSVVLPRDEETYALLNEFTELVESGAMNEDLLYFFLAWKGKIPPPGESFPA